MYTHTTVPQIITRTCITGLYFLNFSPCRTRLRKYVYCTRFTTTRIFTVCRHNYIIFIYIKTPTKIIIRCCITRSQFSLLCPRRSRTNEDVNTSSSTTTTDFARRNYDRITANRNRITELIICRGITRLNSSLLCPRRT